MNDTARGTATYSPDDNKLRFYPLHRLAPEHYQQIKAAGFAWAPKQELFVAPKWTPAREDLLTEWCGEIEDEDKSLVDRAEVRADRFSGYREKRARKDKERIENSMRRAIKLWETSEYWKYRAAGAIRHAKFKELPAVRARRIKTIEAEQRKTQREHDKAAKMLKAWETIAAISDPEQQRKAALHVANVTDHYGLTMAAALLDYQKRIDHGAQLMNLDKWDPESGSTCTRARHYDRESGANIDRPAAVAQGADRTQTLRVAFREFKRLLDDGFEWPDAAWRVADEYNVSEAQIAALYDEENDL